MRSKRNLKWKKIFRTKWPIMCHNPLKLIPEKSAKCHNFIIKTIAIFWNSYVNHFKIDVKSLSGKWKHKA